MMDGIEIRPRKKNVLVIGVMIALALCSLLATDWYKAVPANVQPTFVGRNSCIACHQTQHDQWLDSHHDRAMQLATADTVLGDFNDQTLEHNGVTTRLFRRDEKFFANTEGRDGKLHDFEIKYTFGVEPLQQFMVEFPDGRVQVLRVSWDTSKKEWFYLPPPGEAGERIFPSDPLHWTGVAQNWNSTCAECHSTNFHKHFDDTTNKYQSTWTDIDVSCESCHGPGSLHVQLAEAKSLFWDRNHGFGLPNLKSRDSTIEIETCAACHSRRNTVHANFRPGKPLLDHFDPALLSRSLYHVDGQILDEVFVYGSFLQSKMHAKGVRCTDCHNPHSLELKRSGNNLCAKCHQPGKYDTFSHHHHESNSTGSQCIACHMMPQTYMEVDPRHDHSFRIPRPDLTVELGTPNACNQCHTKESETPEWAANSVVQWFGQDRKGDHAWVATFAKSQKHATLDSKESAIVIEQLVDIARSKKLPSIVRATAIENLGAFANSTARNQVAKLLNDPSELVRLTATKNWVPTSIEQLQATLSPKLADRRRAVRQLAATRMLQVPRHLLSANKQKQLDTNLEEYRLRQTQMLDRTAGHMNLGNLDWQLGRAPQAEAHYRKAIEREPYLTGPRAQLAKSLEILGRGQTEANEIERIRREELELLVRNTRLVPTNAAIRYETALLAVLVKDLKTAEEMLTTATKLAPSNYDYRLALALLQEKREQWPEAIESLRILNQIRPNAPAIPGILERINRARANK